MHQPAKSLVNSLFILSRNEDKETRFIKNIGYEAFDYIKKFINIQKPGNFFIFQGSESQINSSFKSKYNSIIDLNPSKRTSENYHFLENINHYLVNKGLFVGRFEIFEQNKVDTTKRFSSSCERNFWTNYKNTITHIGKNFLEKFDLNKFYRMKVDVLGRLYYYGFEIIAEKEIDNYHYFVAKKTSPPSKKPIPSASPIIKLDRIGKNGKIITIYKLRTMYPYSEYLQQYIFKNNNLESGGKFKNDSRISKIGSFMRKYWIDEIPMILNLIKGDLKLFGVRPLSQQYFDLYTDELKQLRTKYKPGLIPPFYVDLPVSLEEIIKSEKKYLLEYQKRPISTDLKYLFEALYNILIKCKRSR